MRQHVHGRYRDRVHLVALVDEAIKVSRDPFRVRGLTQDVLDGVRLRAVPVDVEDCCQLRHDGADEEHVHVHEIAGSAACEVLVAYIASPHHCERAVRDEQLVVHAMIHTPEVGERSDILARYALSGAAKRIEEAHLDIRERRQALKHRIRACGVEVVDQQPHAHPAKRGVTQASHEQPSAAIVLDEVVLDVERGLRPPDQLDARIQRVQTERHEPEAGQRRLAHGRGGDPDQRTVGRFR